MPKIDLTDASKTSGIFSSKNEYEKFLYDYKKIQTWMTTPSEFLPALQALNQEVMASDDDRKVLSNILLRREQQYGINQDDAPMYTAVLDGPEFVAMNKQGVLPKDHVTPEHGEFTHRLHWYIVLHNATNGFKSHYGKVFYNSPLKLLTTSALKKVGVPKTGWPVNIGPDDVPIEGAYETSFFSMWEALFDRRPFNGCYSITEDWITCPEMFTALLVPHDAAGGIQAYTKLRAKPQTKSYYSMAKQLPALSALVTQRYLKRTEEVKIAGGQTQWAEWYRQKKTGSYEMGEEKGPSYAYLEYMQKDEQKQSKSVLVRLKG